MKLIAIVAGEIFLSCCREVIFAKYYGVEEPIPQAIRSQVVDTLIISDPAFGRAKKVYIRTKDCGSKGE
jgi:hypothetical protein